MKELIQRILGVLCVICDLAMLYICVVVGKVVFFPNVTLFPIPSPLSLQNVICYIGICEVLLVIFYHGNITNRNGFHKIVDRLNLILLIIAGSLILFTVFYNKYILGNC